MDAMSIKNRLSDALLLGILILITVLHLWYQVFNGSSIFDLVNFNTFSYVADRVLFNSPFSFEINRSITGVIPVESMPLLYPPGIYMITKLILLVKDSHIAMNLVIFLLQIINIVFIYLLLRKVSNRFVSFSLTLFLVVYTSSLVVMVDSFIQPLLAITLFFLVSRNGENDHINIFVCGLLTGIIWFMRQNTGLFLSCSIITWLLLSRLSIGGGNIKSGRKFLLWIISVYMICGILLVKTIGPIDDKIWYGLCYFIFWGYFLKHVFKKRNIGLDTSKFIKDLSFFLSPVFIIISCWFYAFGRIIGMVKYFYLQYLMPFSHIDVFEYSILFHLNLAWKSFLQNINQLALRQFYDAFVSLMQWGTLFLMPFVYNCIFTGYGVFRITVKKAIDRYDLKMIALPVMGILTFYPIESFWILSSKLVIFFLPLAYFLNKLFTKKRALLYGTCVIFIILASPRILGMSLKYVTGEYSRRYASYRSVSEREDLCLDADTSGQLQKAVSMVQNVVGDSKFYIADSYTDLEMFYGLTGYKHPNYYIFLRRDCMNDAANQDLVNRLEDYPYILINQQDYLSYKSDRGPYLARPRSIGSHVMEYIDKKYVIIDRYDNSGNTKDNMLSDFFIMKRR